MKKLKSIKGIPLSYIQSILKIDPSSPSGLSWLPREDVQFKYDNKNAGCKHADQRKYQSWDVSITHNNKKYNIKCSRVILLLHNGYLTKSIILESLHLHKINIIEKYQKTTLLVIKVFIGIKQAGNGW